MHIYFVQNNILKWAARACFHCLWLGFIWPWTCLAVWEPSYHQSTAFAGSSTITDYIHVTAEPFTVLILICSTGKENTTCYTCCNCGMITFKGVHWHTDGQKATASEEKWRLYMKEYTCEFDLCPLPPSLISAGNILKVITSFTTLVDYYVQSHWCSPIRKFVSWWFYSGWPNFFFPRPDSNSPIGSRVQETPPGTFLKLIASFLFRNDKLL